MDLPFEQLVAAQNQGRPVGIYSICSAHPFVLKAAMQQSQDDSSHLLIEATSNQVNQFGGYTGMTPPQFVEYVFGIAQECGFSRSRILLGGDHLGPHVWQDLPANQG